MIDVVRGLITDLKLGTPVLVAGGGVTGRAVLAALAPLGVTATVPAAAESAGVPVWGDVELAWRLDAAGHYGPPRRWLAVTGTNGKTTTTSMLQAMLTSAGLR